jgi:tRNA (guanosine-2'-O-)-methyltransferase
MGGFMREITEQRKQRIREVLSRRQPDLTLVLDNIHDPHNVSAIFRSCDAFGVPWVHLYYTTESFPELGRKSSASANKWVEQRRHSQPEELMDGLQSQGFAVFAAGFGPRSVPLPQCDLTRPAAIILGNEHRGASPELAHKVDGELFIPMQGMVQSFNVSVAAALILYEAWRQRQASQPEQRSGFDQETLEAFYRDWCSK